MDKRNALPAFIAHTQRLYTGDPKNHKDWPAFKAGYEAAQPATSAEPVGVIACKEWDQRKPKVAYLNEAGRALPKGTAIYAAPVAAQPGAPDEIRRLRMALVYVAYALHGTPQHMLAEGITLIGGDAVRVRRDGWEVGADLRDLDAPTPPTDGQTQPEATPEEEEAWRELEKRQWPTDYAKSWL